MKRGFVLDGTRNSAKDGLSGRNITGGQLNELVSVSFICYTTNKTFYFGYLYSYISTCQHEAHMDPCDDPILWECCAHVGLAWAC